MESYSIYWIFFNLNVTLNGSFYMLSFDIQRVLGTSDLCQSLKQSKYNIKCRNRNQVIMSDNISTNVQRCEPCALDGDDENASGFCVICIEYLCQGCVKDHRKNKATRVHKVLTGDNIPSDHRVYQRIQELMKCAGHTELNVEYKCENCDQYICSKCVVVGHRKCEKIVDISTIADADTSNDDLKSILDQMATKITAVKVSNESGLRNINQQEAFIQQETNKLIDNVVSKLNTLKDKVFSDTRQTVQNESSVLHEDIGKCEKLERDMKSTDDVLDALRHTGDVGKMNVIPTLLKKTMAHYKSETEKLSERKETKIEVLSQIIISIDEFGKVICRHTDDKLNDILGKKKAEVSSDEVCDSISETTNGDQCPSIFTIKTATDKHVCDISASVVLVDGSVVLADKANKKLKMFRANLKIKFGCSLDEKPVDMCLVKDNLLAVIFDKSAVVKCFRVTDSIRELQDFQTGAYCEKIVRYADDEKILILTNSTLYRGKIELQIRTVPSGKIIQHIDISQHRTFDRLIYAMQFYNDQLLVSTSNDVHCYTVCGFQLKLEWFHKLDILNVTGIDTDKSGQIYASGKKSNKIVRFTEGWT